VWVGSITVINDDSGTTFKISTGRFVNNAVERLDTTVINTTAPDETLNNVVVWFSEQQQKHNDKLSSIGIACFGPVDLDKHSKTYGYITTTPKPNWGNVDVVGVFQKAFPNIPVGFDTDVNAPAVAELASKSHGYAFDTFLTRLVKSILWHTSLLEPVSELDYHSITIQFTE
jgi:predicted NBD/HSP70 family sugar kinase